MLMVIGVQVDRVEWINSWTESHGSAERKRMAVTRAWDL